MGFEKFRLFVIARTVVCVRVCIRIQTVRWFFAEISQCMVEQIRRIRKAKLKGMDLILNMAGMARSM